MTCDVILWRVYKQDIWKIDIQDTIMITISYL